MEKNASLTFPKGFLWGAATSAHQVEGNNRNDWTEWEQKSAKSNVESAKTRAWPAYILERYPNPLQEENYISGLACDHYNRFREDFDIARALGHNAHRFSLEWSRIEPEEGRFDENEIAHYRQVLQALRERGMEPFVTLYHWTLPLWVREQGGWKNKKTVTDFMGFAEKIAIDLKDIRFWIILNEPLVYAKWSFRDGVWPPQQKGYASYFTVVRNLLAAHKAAYAVIKHHQPNAQVGIAHNMSYFKPFKNTWINTILAALGSWQKNFYFLNSIKNNLDFIGFNYYSQYAVNVGFGKEKTKETTDLGWSVAPEGIYYVLKDLKKYGKPVYITENGLADARDMFREQFIKGHLKWIHKAIGEGVHVRGYFHWSLLDNFEWAEGFWPRFGLCEVDYKTMERRPRPSALAYKRICETNGL